MMSQSTTIHQNTYFFFFSWSLSSTEKRAVGTWVVQGRHGQDTPQSRQLLLEKSSFMSTFLKGVSLSYLLGSLEITSFTFQSLVIFVFHPGNKREKFVKPCEKCAFQALVGYSCLSPCLLDFSSTSCSAKGILELLNFFPVAQSHHPFTPC